MARLVIFGKNKLNGSVKIQGSKNGALPVLAAAYASGGESVIHNCPHLSDTECAMRILCNLGCKAYWQGDTAIIDSGGACGFSIPGEAMCEMRSSIIFLGALLTRFGRAEVSMPGGCRIGLRPIDIHISALEQMGMTCAESGGRLICRTDGTLHGANIILKFPSVGATENIMLAASTAKGTTLISNAAREPEIEALADYLNLCGARIYGAGRDKIRIDGVSALHGAEFTVIPDRIVASTYMAAAAVTGGRVQINNVNIAHLSPAMSAFYESGCDIKTNGNSLILTAPSKLMHIKTIITRPYPGFPTDSQPIVMAMACSAQGRSVIIERIFENRLRHIPELVSMGADITVKENCAAIVNGVSSLHGAKVRAEDLRGGGALVIAGLCAEGVTEITGLSHIDRGCERIESYLTALGADIKRME